MHVTNITLEDPPKSLGLAIRIVHSQYCTVLYTVDKNVRTFTPRVALFVKTEIAKQSKRKTFAVTTI